MKDIDLINEWKKEEKKSFEGWDFSYLGNRYDEGYPDWDYEGNAKNFIKNSESVLDMCTGGAEVYCKILSTFKPFNVKAIEKYEPNVSVAQKALDAFGGKVMFVTNNENLPFETGEFDLVLNRHGAFNVKELSRIIRKDGIFFTQQVEANNWSDLMSEFGDTPNWPDNTLSIVVEKLKKEGFKIERAEEWEGKTFFKDIKALVFVLKVIPWTINNFGVEKYKEVLLRLHKKIEKEGKLEFSSKRYLILARKK
ncbi:class I SAM-dependent methyltransferase [Candidatus Woesearchaeota archaeon]|nr:class I SAM-dependent methyltransferase [Candidatus Woesearchaeota archaeon]